MAHSPPAGKVAVDRELGRIAFGSDPAGAIEVGYTYGFGGDLGGGPYDRRDSVEDFLRDFAASQNTWQMGVTQQSPVGAGTQIVTTLGQAVQAWNDQPAGAQGIIASWIAAPIGRIWLVRWRSASRPAAGCCWSPRGGLRSRDASGSASPGALLPPDLRPHLHGG
ncbi:MAG: hypothetical protein IPM84_20330 [Anaerolineae bacterium]|nr:hypothetical protein [Anaerolineae bacterium]